MRRNKGLRILLAGHEIGGQMQLMAETMRKKGYAADSAAFNTDFRQYQNDYEIKNQKIPFQRLLFTLKAIQNYDVFHFFWGISLLDFWRFNSLDLPLLKMLNKKIVVHFRGTDIVDIDYYNYLNAIANGIEVEKPSISRPEQKKKIQKWRKYADRMLVSTPDLLEIVPEATLSPQVVEISKFESLRNNIKTNKVLTIAHAPTRRNTKGTDAIIAAVKNLQTQGFSVVLDLIEDSSPEEVIKRFSKCDVGIDQLLSGWYGKAGVELMAMGKPVLCYIDSRFKKVKADLPIINVTKRTLEENLIQLINNREQISKIGEESVQFAINNHNVDTMVEDILTMYSSI